MIGIAAGLAAAASLTRVMTTLLYDVTPNDIPTFAATTVAMIAIALAACLLPALRAARMDPVAVLRGE